jgi:hypothetical protein
MFNKLNELIHRFKNRYVWLLVIPVVLFQISEALSECHKAWFFVKTIPHSFDFRAKSGKPVLVWLQTWMQKDLPTSPIGARANARSAGNFNPPFLKKRSELAFSGSNISAPGNDLIDNSASRSSGKEGDNEANDGKHQRHINAWLFFFGCIIVGTVGGVIGSLVMLALSNKKER